MKRRPDGTPYDHVRKVRQVQAGLRKRIDQIKRKLERPGLDPAEREALEKELGDSSRMLDKTREYLP